MTTENEAILNWLEAWYASVCDGQWEHMYGITIDTLDNPGWRVKIDLRETRYEDMKLPKVIQDHGEHDWLFCSIKDGAFQGAGDAAKLGQILHIFRECIEGRRGD